MLNRLKRRLSSLKERRQANKSVPLDNWGLQLISEDEVSRMTNEFLEASGWSLSKGEVYCAEIYYKNGILIYTDYIISVESAGIKKIKDNYRPRKVNPENKVIVLDFWRATGRDYPSHPGIFLVSTNKDIIKWGMSPDGETWIPVLDINDRGYNL